MTLTYPNIAQDIEEATLDVKRKGREYKRARKKYLRVAGTQNGFASVDEFKRAKWGFTQAKARLRHLKTLKKNRGK